MQIVSLKEKPADFEFAVVMKNLQGEDVEIPFIGVGRTLKDWMPIKLKRLEEEGNAHLEMVEKQQKIREDAESDAEKAEGKSTAEKSKPKRITLDPAEIDKGINEGLAKGVAKVREFASGWGLDDDFTDENIADLIARYPGVQGLGWNNYDDRIYGNRLGNSAR